MECETVARCPGCASCRPEVSDYMALDWPDRRHAGKHDQVVYCIQFGEGEPVKIGTTCNLGLRLEVIGASHWRPITLLFATRGARPLEATLHARWSEHRIGKHEWFRPAPEILEWWRAGARPDDSLANALERSMVLAKDADVDRAFEGTHGQPSTPSR